MKTIKDRLTLLFLFVEAAYRQALI